MNDDDRRDLRPRRAALPRRLPSRGGVREHAGRDHRRRARLPHARQGAARAGLARRLRRGAPTTGRRRRTTTRARAAAAQARARRAGRRRSRSPSEEKETKPPRRYSDASLLAAMETAGKLVDDEELREAMKDSGIGTPATRAAIIERLIEVGYIERDARALVVHREGRSTSIRLLGEHPLTSPGLTGDWEHRLAKIEHGEDSREAFMARHRQVRRGTVGELDAKLKDVRIPRANLGPCPVCGHDIVENRKGYSCWSREDPGCGFVIWKRKAGKTLPVAVAARADQDRPHREARSPASRAARAARSAPGWRCSRARTASGASSSTSRGRGRAPSRPSSEDAGPARPRRRPPPPRPKPPNPRCPAALRPPARATAEARDHRHAVPAAGDEPHQRRWPRRTVGDHAAACWAGTRSTG